jgi:hypothetical protein
LYKRLKEHIKNDSNNKTINDYLDSKCPSIALTKKYIGEEVVKNEITAHMVTFIDYIGVKNSFTLNHIEILVQDLIDKYYNLKVSEVIFVLKEARTGKYGEMYNNVNPIKIMTWFEAYYNNRLDASEKRNMNKWSGQKQNESKESLIPTFTDGQRLGNVSKIIENINKL